MTKVIGIILACISGVANAAGYPPIYDDYASEHVALRGAKLYKFSDALEAPGDAFRVYAPPGTVYLSIRISTARYAKIGAVGRLNQAPRCIYNTGADYDGLPWMTEATPESYWARDVQLKRRGRIIKITERHFPAPLIEGGWIFLRILSFDGSRVGAVVVTTTVEVKTYNAWYEVAPMEGGMPPVGRVTRGMPCDAAWASVGASEGSGVENPLPEPGPCDPIEAFLCPFREGRRWSEEECRCIE